MRNQVLYSIIGAAALFLVNACQKPVVNPPELKLPTTSFTDVSAAGDVVVVDYTLTNGVEGSEIKVDGDYDWAKVTAIKSASIEVTVDPNETTEPRTAEFTVSYPGVTKDLSFSITQAAGEAPVVDAPVITLEPTSAEVSAAGESGGFNYEIANPVDDGAVSCSVLYPEGDAGGWITCDEVDAEADGRINYEVSANEGEARTATIVVSYPGAEDVDFVISQAAAGGEAGYDYEYTFVTFLAGYFDNETIETADNYNFYMSDGAFEPGDVQYNFDLYTELASNGVLPAGTYTFDERTENYQPGTFSKFSNFRMAGEEADPVAFKGGTITISKDESGNYSFEAELTDANDKTHHVTYTGPMDFGGGDEPSDEVSYEFEYSYLTFYEGEGQNGEDNFFLALSDKPFDADGYETDGCTLANFDIYAAAGTSGVLPAGTYRFDDYNYTEGTFSVGSYIRTPDKEYIYFSDGSIEVTKSGDDYVFEATLTGSKDGKTYKVSYTGPIGEGGGDEPGDVVEYETYYHYLSYYEGNEYDEYYLSLSDMEFATDWGTGAEGSVHMYFNLFSAPGTGKVLPVGEYSFLNSYESVAGTFNVMSELTLPNGDRIRFMEGTLDVSKDAEGTYTLEANLAGADGVDYRITYTGPIGESSGDDPDPADMTFEISVDNMTYDDYTYSIVPSNKETAYIHLGTPKEVLVGYGAMSEDGVINEYVLHDGVISQFLQMQDYRDKLVHTGDLTDASPLFPASSSQEVVVLCYGIDSDDNRITPVTTYKFTMQSMPAVITLDEETIEAGAGDYNGGVYYSLGGDYDPEGTVTAVVENGVDWVRATVDPVERYIEVSVDANNKPVARTATITVSHPSAAESAVLTVNQEAGELVFTTNPNWTVSYKGRESGEDGTYDVTSVVSTDTERFFTAVYGVDSYNTYGIEMIAENEVSSMEYYYGSAWIQYYSYTSSIEERWNLFDPGTYYVIAIGIDDEGNLTGLYQISDPFEPEQLEASDEYNKWLGRWTVTGSNGVENVLEISTRSADVSYTVRGWQFGDYSESWPGITANFNEDGSISFMSEEYGSYDTGQYGVGTLGCFGLIAVNDQTSTVTGGSYPMCTVRLTSDSTAEAVGEDITLTDDNTYDIIGMEYEVILSGDYEGYIFNFTAEAPLFPLTMQKADVQSAASVKSAGLSSAGRKFVQVRQNPVPKVLQDSKFGIVKAVE